MQFSVVRARLYGSTLLVYIGLGDFTTDEENVVFFRITEIIELVYCTPWYLCCL